MDRLGTDLSDDPHFTVGYAPPGPTSLIGHLTREGATETELIDAGLARRTDRGRLVDAFRDRVVFPIHHGSDVVGFIGRRNPTRDDDEYAGPKYLNSRATFAFIKGAQLFGLAGAADLLAAGSTPVLVEGPLDAIAVTHATHGRFAGVAPLGTAFTPEQAGRLRPLFRHRPSNIVIATDSDPAGWSSAQRAFWRLAQYRADPQHLVIRPGLDPADLLRIDGSSGLSKALEETRPLAESLVDSIIYLNSGDRSSAATRLRLVRDTAQVIGALPPEQWLTHIERVTEQADLPIGVLHLEVLDAGAQWTNDSGHIAAQHVAEVSLRQASPRWTTTDKHKAPARRQSQATRSGNLPDLTAWAPARSHATSGPRESDVQLTPPFPPAPSPRR